MKTIRASSAASCFREIVAKRLDPEGTVPDKAKMPFLKDGHFFQASVTEFLQDRGVRVFNIEAEGKIDLPPDVRITGHIDGALRPDQDLLEIKAIKNASFERLKASSDFREVYGHYTKQVQIYMGLTFKPALGFTPLGTVFIFKNRDTGEMLGGLEIAHPAYEFRPDMVEEKDDDALEFLENRFLDSLTYSKLPPKTACDWDGPWCFFCRRRTSKGTSKVFEGTEGYAVVAGHYALLDASAAKEDLRTAAKVLRSAGVDFGITEYEGETFEVSLRKIDSALTK